VRLVHRILALAIGFAIVAGAAHPADAQFGRNKVQYRYLKWQVLTTPHFEFYFHQGAETFVVRAALIMEDGYAMLAGKLGETLPWRVPVILYAAHNDFLENNIADTLLPEGVQAFAEPSRKRIVLPFTGSYKAFAHTAIHELSHVFTFQIVYNRLLDSVFSQNYLFPMPLWLAEGVAEYLSVGWDAESDMFIRDAVIHDYLTDLDYEGGFMVYKAGQSALNYIEDTYGKEKVRELLFSLGSTRSGDVALERTLGLDVREFSARWKKALRKHYWPMYGEKTSVEDMGRRLTNHVKERAYYNTKAVMSPNGEKIAYFSDRDGFMSIFIMSTVDNKVIKKLVGGYRSSHFESLHFFDSSMSFSPDGKCLAFVAKSKGRDLLYIIDANNGRVKKTIKVDCDEVKSPAWSPKGNEICVSANFGGQTDLVLVSVDTGKTRRLTNDAADQLNPRYFPDGKRIAFTYYPELTTIPVPRATTAEGKRELSEMDFLSYRNVRRDASFDIYEIDIESGVTQPLVATAGDDDGAVVFDEGRKMLFVSDVSGISNLYLADLEKGTNNRITDVLSGVFYPDVCEAKNRLTYTAFIEGGYDVFISDELDKFLKSRYSDEPVLAGIGKGAEGSAASGESSLTTETDILPVAAILEKTASRAAAKKEEPSSETSSVTQSVFSVADEDSTSIFDVQPRLPKDRETTVKNPPEKPAADQTAAEPLGAGHTGGPPGPGSIEGIHRPVSAEEPVSRGGSVTSYKLKLAPDFIGTGGLYFATGYGFGLANTIALSDILGDHRMVLSFNIQKDIANSDIFASYYYLKRRVNYGIGVFQYRNFLDSPVSSIGESFGNYKLFAERNYGLYGLVSVPFSTFNRVDFELQTFMSERVFFDEVSQSQGQVYYQETAKSKRRLFEPSISYVHDASFYDMFGPVEGGRWLLSVSKGVGFDNTGVSRSTLYLDMRKYKRVFYRNSFAFRLAFAGSEGDDARSFFLGGPSTLRGYDYLAFDGSRMALGTIEYRFPLIDALILGFPGRWGLGNIGGKVFFDAGATWNKNDLKVFRSGVNGVQFDQVLGDFGFGVHFYLAYFLLNFQFAWQTDLHDVYANHFTFFIGPAF
jgi:Tol biopolymer transport system component